MDPLTALIGGVIVTGSFVLGLFQADRAYNRDRKEWQTERIEKNKIVRRQADAIHELQADKNDLMDDNRALQAQNWALAQQRFALLNSGEGQQAA